MDRSPRFSNLLPRAGRSAGMAAAVCLGLFLSSGLAAAAEEPVPLSDYVEYARACADRTWEEYDAIVEAWRNNLDPENVFGYRAPGKLLEMAGIYAVLFEREGRAEYAERSRRVLREYGDFREAYPKEAAARRADYQAGVPALPDFFTTMRYLRAMETLDRLGALPPEERQKARELAGGSLNYLLRTQEWGAMNRAALRAETLAWAVRAMPDHPQAKYWRMYEEALRKDNWGQWEIEDATIYHAVWLYALLGEADARREREDLFAQPTLHYYAHYFLQLMSPSGMIPDFGDARWNENWSRYLVFFEAAAAAYRDPELKWAATRIARAFLDLTKTQDVGLAYLLLDAWRYGADDLKAYPPSRLSGEVLEDVVGKKVVFRSGWGAQDTYLLLNYRDEGDGGFLFRSYLRDTIPVEEEKMTHGHADEGGIALLMAGGSVLLHDGGYRDYMPSGPYGAYRQDYFHNRLCVRPEKIFMGQKEGEYRYSTPGRAAVPGQAVLDFLHDAGSYRPVRTRKVDFLSFTDFDYSRTRVEDAGWGYAWDRVIVYVKDPGLFVVFDLLKASRPEYFTACNLWHTRQIFEQGAGWYDTGYDTLSGEPLNEGTRLLICFPKVGFRLERVEDETRHYQPEKVIAQVLARHFETAQHDGFITVLVPHPAGEVPNSLLGRIRPLATDPAGEGLGVEIANGGEIIRVGVKCDLRREMVRDFRRPKYTWESGRIAFEDLETNGDFFFLRDRGEHLSYTVVNVTKAVYKGKVLFEQPPSFFGLAFDGSPDSAGVGKARYWRDEM